VQDVLNVENFRTKKPPKTLRTRGTVIKEVLELTGYAETISRLNST
jgi:hypothetical protein